jgi:hypothetical protein
MPLSTGEALDPLAFTRKRTSTTTETIDVTGCPRIEITIAGNTLSLANMRDMTRIEIANRSSGNALLGFDVELQGTVYSSPATMPAGDVYELVYDAANTRWVF